MTALFTYLDIFFFCILGICRNNAAEYRKDPSVWYTKLGLHLEKPTSNKYIVAIGECGISNILETKEIETKLFEHMVFTCITKLTEFEFITNYAFYTL